MDNRIFYNIHNTQYDDSDTQWKVGDIIDFSKEYNHFYEHCIKSAYTFKAEESDEIKTYSNWVDYELQKDPLDIHEIKAVLNMSKFLISEYQMLLREVAYENVRKDYYQELPSRKHAIWLCKEKNNYFFGNIDYLSHHQRYLK